MYDRGMRTLLVCALAAACGGKTVAPPKPPNTDLIVGKYERHPPDGTTAATASRNTRPRCMKFWNMS